MKELGYHDADGNSLEADGSFGPHTRAAVEAFQRDHQLIVDGEVGPRTLHALEQAVQQKSHDETVRLDDLRHPDHALYQQALTGVQHIDATIGRRPDTRSENLAAALAVAAREQGLQRIDQVMLSENGTRAFALEYGSFARMAHVQTAEAVRTSASESSVMWAEANHRDMCHTTVAQPMPVPQPVPQAMGR
ncbi:XVIPCD domain-containing protein [Rhodanobacter sp. FW102-FHT14D07]|uniref:XVIPCD domain-containing protein n=1 Tax=Rhodanobacter sp. FW102-FHT14D07 TaxID=3351462 RepID=A0AB74UV98_9GAMM